MSTLLGMFLTGCGFTAVLLSIESASTREFVVSLLGGFAAILVGAWLIAGAS